MILATKKMHSYYQNNLPFNEWYQTWSTYASRATADDNTKIWAFKKLINSRLLEKLIGISPAPTTLLGWVEKARELDEAWQMYKPTRREPRSGGPRSREITTGENNSVVQVNAQTSNPRGKLTKEERERRFKNKLCLYCGKPNHMAKDCRVKKTTDTGRNSQGCFVPKVRSTTLEEVPEEEPEPVQVSYLTMWHKNPVPRPAFTPSDF